MPGTASYAQNGAFAYALSAAAAVHFDSVVSVIVATLLHDGDVVVIAGIIIIVVVVIIVVVIVVRAQNVIRAFGLRLHLGLQEQQYMELYIHYYIYI